jgi:hypothetical protein
MAPDCAQGRLGAAAHLRSGAPAVGQQRQHPFYIFLAPSLGKSSNSSHQILLSFG